ncbi:TerB family tellurite resistance protein [Thioalkalivibrio sulfidiphilus]|uniref:tellurite resistance TerB family protein n=1 Tax=Thioalkalivibrio sulfidiphilus TaxID=1033854 RepID=UPI00036BEC9E|nr:TerB family tellurite resistance protein [Thioalkalivibrio sulfidiphilus]
MLDRIRRFFDEHIAAPAASVPAPRFASGKTRRPDADPTHALHLATAALLFEVSRADFHVHDKELEAMAQILERQFQLSAEETRELLDLARAESDEMLSLHPFVRLINENFEPDQRARIMEDLWQVAYAKGELDKHQEYTVRKIADLLYVPHPVYIRTKLKIEEGARGKRQETRDK